MENKENKKEQEQFFYSVERGITATPQFLELWKGQSPWIQCGADNLYPQELLRLFLNSSGLHSSIIKKKADMIAANGFEKKELTGLALNFLKNRFTDDTLDVIAYKAAMDIELFGGFYLKIGWSKDKKSIARISHVPAEKVRIAKPTKDENGKLEERKYYVSRDWTNYRRAENEPVCFYDFNPLNNENCAEQILFVRTYTPGAEYYSLPVYTPVINYIKLAYEISVFHLKSIQNNLNAGLIVTMVGAIPPKEQRDADYERLKARYAGAEPSGDIMILYGANKDAVPIITPMPSNNSDARFKDLVLSVNENIRIGHNVSSIVANVETAGRLGTPSDIIEAYSVFQNTVINNSQKIIEDTFNKLAFFNGVQDELVLEKYKFLDINNLDEKNELELAKNLLNKLK